MKFVYRYIGVTDKQLHEQVISDVSRDHADRQFMEVCGDRVLWEFPIVVRLYQPFTMMGRVQYLHNEGYQLLAVLPVDPSGLRAKVVYRDQLNRHEEECAVSGEVEWEEVHKLFSYINMGAIKNGASHEELESL